MIEREDYKMDYRKVCSECNEPSDEFNTDVFGKVICGECGVQSHCFCEECDEYVPTSHCSVEDEVIELGNGKAVDETNVICNVCDENSDEDNSCGWYEKEKKNGVQKFTKPSQDHRREENSNLGIISSSPTTLGVWDIKFYKEDDEGNQTLYEYNGDCSVICDMINEDELKEIK